MRADVAIILCAGGSRRMGRPKGLLPLDGAPLLVRQVEAFRPFAERIVVVLGARADAHARVLPEGVQVVINPDWERTHPADSLHRAVVEADVRGRAWVTPVDVAPPLADTLSALLGAGAPSLPVDDRDRDGHPVLLDSQLLEALRVSAPPGGLRTLLGEARRVRVDDPLVAEDFDDPDAWAAYEALSPRSARGTPGCRRR